MAALAAASLASIGPCQGRIVAQSAQQIRYWATRLTANSLWKQLFGGNRQRFRAPLFLASTGIIHYPRQSAAAGIRFL
jgi:hypothetical protein